MSPVEWTEEEIEQQKKELMLNNREETIEQEVPKVLNRKKLYLFCLHKKVVRKGEFVICTKCGAKWKVNYSVGTTK